MNIALCTGTFLPQINGVISYVIDTATTLVHHGHAVYVIAPKPKKNIEIDTSKYPFRVFFLPSISAMIYPDLRVTNPSIGRFTTLMQELNIDLVHLNDPSPLCMGAMGAAKLLKLPVVITFHTFYFDPDVLKAIRFGKVFGMFKGPLVKLNTSFHNGADIVICPSASAQKELIDSGLTAQSIVIPNGINFSLIHTFSAKEIIKLREEYHVPPSVKVGIFVGRLASDKRVDVLLKAWSRVVKDNPDAVLFIVGSGPQDKKLHAAVDAMRLSSNVVFTGPIDRTKLLREGLYAIADIYVSASRIENLSMSMIEAMAYGLPIVAVNMRGVSELVDDSNGILTKTGSLALSKGIVEAFHNPDRLKKLGEGSRKKALQFSTETTNRALESVYEQLISAKQTHP